MRDVPDRMSDRLIVALDVPTVREATALVSRLDDQVRFFKIGHWLLLAPDSNELIDWLLQRQCRVFIDAKLYDIPETVRAGVRRVAERGVHWISVHSDLSMVEAAMQGADGEIQVFPVTGLSSNVLLDAAFKVRMLRWLGCYNVIMPAAIGPDGVRTQADAPDLVVASPGVREAFAAADDHAMVATPGNAVCFGADYLIVGRPIIRDADPAAAAQRIIHQMENGWAVRRQSNEAPPDNTSS